MSKKVLYIDDEQIMLDAMQTIPSDLFAKKDSQRKDIGHACVASF